MVIGTKFWIIWGALQGAVNGRRKEKKKVFNLISQACGRPWMLQRSGKEGVEGNRSKGAGVPSFGMGRSGRQAARRCKAWQEGGQTGLVCV